MIAKILSSTGTFAAVRYNTDKMDKHSGELMHIRNFGLLDNDFALRPEEVRNYLKAVSAMNKKVKKPQFHATISCKGREYSKSQLSDIAVKWMDRMGYGKNPYIVVFHNDTQNNHVHIVSTRVGLDGKKISDSFEHLRAFRYLDEILSAKSEKKWEDNISRILEYHVISVAQLKLLFEAANFQVKESAGNLSIYKAGFNIRNFNKNDLNASVNSNPEDKTRINQLRAIIKKYRDVIDTTLVPEYRKLKGKRSGEVTGYKSDLTDYLRTKFGLQFVFHFKKGKVPYGYTLIDNSSKSVFKGSQLIKLAEFTKSMKSGQKSSTANDAEHIKKYNIPNNEHVEILSSTLGIPNYKFDLNYRQITSSQLEFYRDLLKFFLDKNPIQDLNKINVIPVQHVGRWYLIDNAAMNILDAKEVLSRSHYATLTEEVEETNLLKPSTTGDFVPGIGWEISHDVDDEKVHGAERNKDHRKSKNR